MLGDVFAEFGYDIDTFAVVAEHQVDDPAFPVQFPDPLDYDVVVPLGARWAVYDEQLKQNWVADEMALVRAADAAGVGVLGVCFGGQLVAPGVRRGSPSVGRPRDRLAPDHHGCTRPDSRRSVVPVALRPLRRAAGCDRTGPQQPRGTGFRDRSLRGPTVPSRAGRPAAGGMARRRRGRGDRTGRPTRRIAFGDKSIAVRRRSSTCAPWCAASWTG